jgi:hypothetical protein
MPPRSTRGRGGSVGGIRVGVKVDAARASEEFRQIRRDANQNMRQALRIAGEKDILPRAKIRAGGLAVTSPTGAKTRTASTLTVKPRAREAILTTSVGGKTGRAVGLQEFGGDVSTTILPRKKKALTVNGDVVSSVSGTRHYHPHRFMLGAVDTGLDAFTRTLLRETMRLFRDFD